MYYREITLLPDTILPLNILQTKVFTGIHVALVAYHEMTQNVDISVSFPKYGTGMGVGDKIRLLADNEQNLKNLNLHFLSLLRDYVHITKIKKVPARIKGYATYSRWQPAGGTTRVELMVLEYLKNHKKKSYEEATAKVYASLGSFPYIQMVSASNKQHFRLYIKKTDKDNKSSGSISSYGLSREAAVPIF